MNDLLLPQSLRPKGSSPINGFQLPESASACLPSGWGVEQLPRVLRIQSIAQLRNIGAESINRAVLTHQRCKLCVDWIADTTDHRLYRHRLVSLQPAQTASSQHGALRIERLLPAEQPLPTLNLFETVPPGWVKDRRLVRRAAELWEELPRPLAALVNAVLWEGRRFHRFVTGPASLQQDPRVRNGNFMHSIEVAERARALARQHPQADVPLLIASGLLHNVAKAEEMRLDRTQGNDRDTEVAGPGAMAIKWISEAKTAGGVAMDAESYWKLLNMIAVVSHCPRLSLVGQRGRGGKLGQDAARLLKATREVQMAGDAQRSRVGLPNGAPVYTLPVARPDQVQRETT